MIPAFDLLGIGHRLWKAKQIIPLLPSPCMVCAFDTEFGDSLPEARLLLKSGKVVAYETHLFWDRSNRHQIAPMPTVKRRAPKYEQLKQQFPDVDIFVSHSCEHNNTNKNAIMQRMDAIRQKAPSCIPVNSVWKGATIPGEINERHGSKVIAKPGEIVSLDGENCYDIDILSWLNKNSKARFAKLWGYRWNLREIPDPGQSVPPPEKRRAKPSKKYSESIMALYTNPGTPPNPTFSGDIRPIQDPRVWKSHAEDDQEEDEFAPDDPRENRPVFICETKAKSLQIVTYRGDCLGNLKYGGGFGTHQHRYYSGLPGGVKIYGYEIAQRAQSVSGSPWTWLNIDNVYYGPFHGAFRRGNFR